LPPGLEVVINAGLTKVSAERINNALDYAQRLDDAVRAAGYDPLHAVPRSSSQLPIPSGPHSIATPAPGSLFMTPQPQAYGSGGTRGGYSTPAHGNYATPSPDLGHAPTESHRHIVQQRRATSIVDTNEPLPRAVKMAALVMVLLAVMGAVYFMFVRNNKAGETKTSIVTVPVAVPSGLDKETMLKAALHDLANGETCADRKAAIPILVKIGDDRAIAALKKARNRYRGGVLGIGSSNTNACLKSDAETAITALGGTIR